MNKPILFLQGFHGKMGTEIRQIATTKNWQCLPFEDLAKCQNINDAWIVDFSSPSGLSEAISIAQDVKIPLISGTTSFAAEIEAKLHAVAQEIPVLWCPNFAIGMQFFFQTARLLAKSLPEFDIKIVEVHHRDKKDAPSGTARTLKSEILKERSLIKGNSQEFSNTQKTIEIHSLRGGEIFGKHEILYLGNGETITITHEANNRKIFANGVITALKRMAERRSQRKLPAKLYTFEEILSPDFCSAENHL